MARLAMRTAWARDAGSFGEALAAARARGQDLLDLCASNPTRVGLHYPAAELSAALAGTAALPYTPVPLGLASAREAVARPWQERGWRGGSEHVLLTASTSEAYSHLFRLLLDPGDSLLVPRPSYPLFHCLAGLDDVRLLNYRLDPAADWAIDLAEIEAAIDGSTRAIVVVSPNNPTGSLLRRGELDTLARLCRGHDLALIGDEVFGDYVFTTDREAVGGLPSAAGLEEVLWFAMGGLAKSAGLPGHKLAWTLAGGPPTQVREALARLAIIADAYLSPAMPIQAALPRLLELAPGIQGAIRARLRQNLAAIERLAGTPVSALPVAGGWSVVLRLPAIRSDEEWAGCLLAADSLALYPGHLFEFDRPTFLVASLLPAPEVFSAGLDRLVARVGREC